MVTLHPSYPLRSHERQHEMTEQPASFAMYATSPEGSIAEMPLGASGIWEAREQAKAWLDGYEHGFTVAVIASAAEITLLSYATTLEVHSWIIARAYERGNILARTVGHVSELGEGERLTIPLADVIAGDWILSAGGWHRVVWTREDVNCARYESGGSESGYPYAQSVFRPTTPFIAPVISTRREA